MAKNDIGTASSTGVLVHRVRCELAQTDLRPSNLLGMLHLGMLVAVTVMGIALSASSSILGWMVGQGLVAVALMQWFILLHEAGHMTLFRGRVLNVCAGHLASVFAFIPFASWRRIHGLHHVWTGWQDKDPTTASLTPRRRGRLTRAVVDIAWRCWLPLFSVVYRLGNYWHLPRLWAQFPLRRQRIGIVLNAGVLLVLYGVIGLYVGWASVVSLFGVAVLLGLALQDPIILSQHTHIPQPVSGGRRVAPLTAREQLPYTRSLRFPGWFARWVLLNFNAHELHHLHAGVPGYRLMLLDEEQPSEVHWWTWLKAAKRMRGSEFVFGNRTQTGFEL